MTLLLLLSLDLCQQPSNERKSYRILNVRARPCFSQEALTNSRISSSTTPHQPVGADNSGKAARRGGTESESTDRRAAGGRCDKSHPSGRDGERDSAGGGPSVAGPTAATRRGEA